MVDIVKTTLDVSLDEPHYTSKLAGNLAQRRVTTSVRPKPVRVFVKCRFIDGFQNHSDCFLQELITKGRNPKGPLAPVFLLDIFPSDRFYLITAVFQVLNQFLYILFAESVGGIVVCAFGQRSPVCVELLVGGVINVLAQQVSVEPREYAVRVFG